MNLLEVWIEDVISIEGVKIDGIDKIKVTFNTICWGSRGIDTRIFNNIKEWEKFKERKYYLA
ncbi:hypothetical protein [Clostridium sp.]|uniref:hypothetical protein n=1 Tax=Clostridium sp. TaxID=1506 RepID=UPI001DEDC059|nr:hypothetical protein [Clostridium sp.]MBS5307759.1 hypothetical protein [Clostridium sp.]MDU3410077.1 hypothetical protein [Clostridium sp.]